MVMGQTTSSIEVLVIGGGPGGYVAAIRAAQLGFDVMLVDKAGELGGMCLHHGCIPSKALIHAMGLFHDLQNGGHMGITAQVQLNFSETMAWKNDVIRRLYQGIAGLCKKHNITVVKAAAKFQSPSRVILEGEDLDFNAVEFRHCVIATGSSPRQIDIAPFGGNILSSREALELTDVPKRLVVVGGGYIGIELGVMYRKAGAELTIIEAGPTLLGMVEPELAQVAKKRLEALGATVLLDTPLTGVDQNDSGVVAHAGDKAIEADKVLIAVGHAPVTSGLQVDLAGVACDERGFIKVDNQMRTSQQHIFAVGDCVGGVMLAHKATAEGKIAAEVIAGHPAAFDFQGIPAVIFSDPEIATVGLREKEARERYGDGIKVGVFPFSALGKALAIDATEGFVKLIADSNGVLVGIHMAGPSVTDLISEAALAIEMGATAEDLALTIHPHPTLGESLAEASEALLGQCIHLYQPK